MSKWVLGILFFISSSVFAGEWTNNLKIDWVRAYPGEATGHFIKISDRSVNEGCSYTENTGIINLEDSGGRVYSAVLAAVMGGREVRFYLSGCTTSNYAVIKEVQVNAM